jgi:hypothetical protein
MTIKLKPKTNQTWLLPMLVQYIESLTNIILISIVQIFDFVLGYPNIQHTIFFNSEIFDK